MLIIRQLCSISKQNTVAYILIKCIVEHLYTNLYINLTN